MKTALPSHTFLDLRAAAKLAVDRKATLPILSAVLITQEARGCSFTATDLDLAITRTEPACGLDLQDGSIAVRLTDLAAIRPDKGTTVYFRLVHPNDHTVEVRFVSKGLGVTRSVKTLPVKEFPPIPIAPSETATRLLPPSTIEAIRTCLPFVSSDITRYVLNGVFLDSARGGAAVATDGRRLVKLRAMGLAFPVILPTKLCQAMTALFTRAVAVATVSPPDNVVKTLCFRSGAVTITSRTIEGNFPSYHQVIPPASEHRFTLPDPDPLVSWLLTCTDPKATSVKLTISRDHLTCSSPTGGTVRHPVYVEGRPDVIALNPIFFAHAIQSGCRTFCMNSEREPLLGLGPASLVTVLMPMRVDAACAVPEPSKADATVAA